MDHMNNDFELNLTLFVSLVDSMLDSITAKVTDNLVLRDLLRLLVVVYEYDDMFSFEDFAEKREEMKKQRKEVRRKREERRIRRAEKKERKRVIYYLVTLTILNISLTLNILLG
jgi:hypothetical protein